MWPTLAGAHKAAQAAGLIDLIARKWKLIAQAIQHATQYTVIPPFACAPVNSQIRDEAFTRIKTHVEERRTRWDTLATRNAMTVMPGGCDDTDP